MHTPSIHAILICILCLTMTFMAVSTEASTWQVVTENTGLGGRSANCVAPFGKFLAVGTDKGVSIYNGDSCTWQPLPLPEEIASISVVDIAADESGGLWLATNRGLINVQGKQTYIYGPESNLPTLDINRIQIEENRIYAGCFGGYIVSAFIPQGGMAKFSPVNYQTDPDSATLKIRSVGVSAMAMQSNFQGWISTMCNGLIEVSGSNEFTATNCANQPESWVNDFYIFHEGKSREKRFLAVTPEYLSLIKNGQAQREIRLPKPDQWLNCVVTVKENPDFFDWVPLPEMQGDEEFLADFIGRRWQCGFSKNFTATLLSSMKKLTAKCSTILIISWNWILFRTIPFSSWLSQIFEGPILLPKKGQLKSRL
ncbi:MAG TPA: hypothetical protein PKC25_03525 [Candidatus Rifleibacterium sp.]|nr:hypothetical protein [Candidatus Rifleibacterium sp.]